MVFLSNKRDRSQVEGWMPVETPGRTEGRVDGWERGGGGGRLHVQGDRVR